MSAPTSSPSFLAVVNATVRDAETIADDLERGIRSRDLSAEVAVTSSVDDVRRVVAGALDRGTRGFLAVGGDGTAHHLVNALVHDAGEPTDDAAPAAASPSERTCFTILAAGTGSDFARTFAHDGRVDAALDRLVRRERYPVDVGWIEGSFGRRWFLNAANAGIAAQSVITASRMPRRIGALRYTAAFWLSLPRFPGADIAVTIDHHAFEGEALNVVVANGQFFGGGLHVAPRATLVDGRFDVLVFSGARANAFSVMPRLKFGSHLTHRAVHRYVGGDVAIRVPSGWPVEADGELLGHGPIRIGIAPEALDYLV